MSINQLRTKWQENTEAYKIVEIGGGVHNFVNDVLSHPELFALKLTPKKTVTQQTYVHDTEAEMHGRPDFVLYVNKDITIPCEVKCYTRIEEGLKQLQRYRSDYTKEYGILTDGFTWRFYRSNAYEIWTLDQILETPKLFRTFWENYLKPESYYTELFQPSGQGVLFDDPLDLNDPESREIFFKETSQLIARFRTKIKTQDDKAAFETAYAYLIQFILYKVLVDNRFKRFEEEYKLFKRQIAEAIRNKDLYNLVVSRIRGISEYISQKIYQPFAAEQSEINEKLIADLNRELTIQDIAPWLDIISFIDRFHFANLQNEIFGFVYENYLKDLYDKNWGQFFTDPAVVNFMLDELGYTPKELAKDGSKISIIDPACGAGTFLYSAVDRIIEAFGPKETQTESLRVKELVDKNVFGLDVAEFPLYLAEMCILLRQLPLIVTDLYDSPVEKKLKLFKTRDSIAEFLDANIGSQSENTDWDKLFSDTDLGYPSFMRDNKDLQEMIESMQGHNGKRFRFDFVIGNPPYVGYNDCCKKGMSFVKKIQDPQHKFNMGNVFGVNLHTVPGMPKTYAPKPNLYAFFMALGLALLRENGKLCFIVPQTLLTAGDLDVLRHHLAKNTTIDKIITFGGNLFIERGVKAKRQISTSSLIIVVTKKQPKPGHHVKIVNFLEHTGKQAIRLQAYLNNRNKNKKVALIPQSELANAVENWNYIKHDKIASQLLEQYNGLNYSIEEYRRKCLGDYNEVQFDKGLVFDKVKISTGSEDWLLPNKINGCFRVGTNSGFIATEHIRIPQGSQGLKIFENKYKIIWRYMNPDRFYYSDKKIMIGFNWVIISSKNRKEILFLLSLLNSGLSKYILNLYLKNANEKALQVGIKTIKNFIRIPRITSKNQKIKDKIIVLTESMLAIEHVVLRDIVDFGRLNVQKFDTIAIEKNELILSSSREFRLKIADDNTALVKKVVQEKYKDGGLFSAQLITLTELKSLPAIDFDKQAEIKKQIDNLVFALYFSVSVKDVAQHEFYGYVNS